ncbi:DNA-binding response regulator [Sporanaerobium hydrogeniformans]|uniref:DNA-binding response regulator n=1 Tax=Sporanaerobium hydrogeniformans TaxID=3072179 RepID=A0AC61DA02_9FIRM|nr:response regulator [Sporanaerobium hydrogeniformans]PHV69710.1 DNA-binding response regulator [Sporanaerobium hydrogeniformans]
MYKVVIIDDEPIIVEGLKRSINWSKWGCKVVETAGSGREGIEVIQREKPDILFSDICMAPIDGLTMIASIIAQFPNMEIAILTGYRNFDYAQQAIELGVRRYLLKPSKMEEMEETIGLMVSNLDSYYKSKKVREEKETITKESQEEILQDDHSANSFIVKNALEYIQGNYMSKLKLSDVANKVYISQWYLSKLLNKHTGQNFSEILNHVRIKEAKKLLENPELRIGDIADEVGFLDVAHFSRVFKKVEGISANQYRNTVLGRN